MYSTSGGKPTFLTMRLLTCLSDLSLKASSQAYPLIENQFEIGKAGLPPLVGDTHF